MPPKIPRSYEAAILDEMIINQFMLLYNRLIDSGTSIIKFLFVMNSGAILVLLTFVGNQHSPHLFYKLQWTFKWLIIGALTSVLCGIAELLHQVYALSEFKRRFNEKSNENKKNNYLIPTWLIATRFMGLISLIAFTVSIFKALHILSGCGAQI